MNAGRFSVTQRQLKSSDSDIAAKLGWDYLRRMGVSTTRLSRDTARCPQPPHGRTPSAVVTCLIACPSPTLRRKPGAGIRIGRGSLFMLGEPPLWGRAERRFAHRQSAEGFMERCVGEHETLGGGRNSLD